jgi:hypothetical protein
MTATLGTLRKAGRIYGYSLDCRECGTETVWLLRIAGARSKDRAMNAVLTHNRERHP